MDVITSMLETDTPLIGRLQSPLMPSYFKTYEEYETYNEFWSDPCWSEGDSNVQE